MVEGSIGTDTVSRRARVHVVDLLPETSIVVPLSGTVCWLS